MIKSIILSMTALLLSSLVTVHAQEASATPVDNSAELAKSTIGKMVSSVKLQQVKNGAFKEAKLTKVPEYYILYFSASW